MNPAPSRSPARESLPPRLGGNLGQLPPDWLAHFSFTPLTWLQNYRSRLSQIIFRARCWLLTKEVALRVWWRG